MIVDHNPDPNLHRVARIAAELGVRIRDEDPSAMFRQLHGLCQWHPAKAAQLLMVFAVWFDPEESVEVLVARAEAVSAPRIAVAS